MGVTVGKLRKCGLSSIGINGARFKKLLDQKFLISAIVRAVSPTRFNQRPAVEDALKRG
jgi:hypothetical protein